MAGRVFFFQSSGEAARTLTENAVQFRGPRRGAKAPVRGMWRRRPLAPRRRPPGGGGAPNDEGQDEEHVKGVKTAAGLSIITFPDSLA